MNRPAPNATARMHWPHDPGAAQERRHAGDAVGGGLVGVVVRGRCPPGPAACRAGPGRRRRSGRRTACPRWTAGRTAARRYPCVVERRLVVVGPRSRASSASRSGSSRDRSSASSSTGSGLISSAPTASASKLVRRVARPARRRRKKSTGRRRCRAARCGRRSRRPRRHNRRRRHRTASASGRFSVSASVDVGSVRSRRRIRTRRPTVRRPVVDDAVGRHGADGLGSRVRRRATGVAPSGLGFLDVVDVVRRRGRGRSGSRRSVRRR